MGKMDSNVQSSNIANYKKPRQKVIVAEYFENATIHGLSKIRESNSIFSRVFWIFIFIAFLGFVIYQVSILFSRLASHEYTTVLSSSIHNGGLEFPSITICNANPFPLDRLLKFFKKRNGNATTNSTNEQLLKTFRLISANLNESETAEIGYQLNEIMTGMCSFDKKNCSNHFGNLTTPDNGNCYIFNINGSLLQPQAGIKAGLFLIMDIQQKTYIPSDDFHESIPIGIQISIHSPGSKFNYMHESIIIPPNQLTRIAIKKREINRLKTPYIDNCTEESVLINNQYNYTVDLCFQQCFLEGMFERCKAVERQHVKPAFNLIGKKLNVVQSSNDSECVETFEMDFRDGKIKCDCNLVCKEVKYTMTASNGLWPSENEKQMLSNNLRASGRNVTDNYVANNLVALQVYFDDFTVEKITHLPGYDIHMLFGDLGGQFGLWLGASIYSFIEISILLLQLPALIFLPKKKLNEKETPTNATTLDVIE